MSLFALNLQSLGNPYVNIVTVFAFSIAGGELWDSVVLRNICKLLNFLAGTLNDTSYSTIKVWNYTDSEM